MEQVVMTLSGKERNQVEKLSEVPYDRLPKLP